MESLQLTNNSTDIIKIYEQTFCSGAFVYCSFIGPIEESSRSPTRELCHSKSNDLFLVC